MLNSLLVEEMQIVPAFGPVDLSAAAANGDWVSLKGYDRCTVIVFKGAGTAGDDPTLTLKQAQDVSGTNAKALNFTRIDKKKGTLTAVGTFSTVTQAAANTYLDDSDAEAAALYAIEVKSEELDVNNGSSNLRNRSSFHISLTFQCFSTARDFNQLGGNFLLS